MKSPCVKICRLDAENICIGCGRSVAEIRRWKTYSDEERDAILERLATRQTFSGSAAD